MSIPDVIHDSIITADGHKYTGEMKTIEGVVGLVFEGKGEIAYTNGDRYEGAFVRNQRSGAGTLTYADGGSYEGEWHNDMRHGCGSLTEASGSVFEGTFVEDKKHGMGMESLASGESYTGKFDGNMRHGRGILDLPDGSVYEGHFVQNFQQGKGCLKYPSGDVFEGKFHQSAMHGHGRYTFANGDLYEGEYKDGVRINGSLQKKDGPTYDATFSAAGEVTALADPKSGAEIEFKHLIDEETGEILSKVDATDEQSKWKNGYGSISYADKSAYTGTFEDNLPHGEGTRKWENGDVYEGSFYEGRRHGAGKMTWDRVQQFPHHPGWRYLGNFANDLFDGHGELRYDTEGGHYSGFWQQGRREGLGKEVVTGTTYQGSFLDDQRHGEGILTLADGTVIEGKFADGSCADEDGSIKYADESTYQGGVAGTDRHGEGHLEYANGDVFDGEFRHNERFGVGVMTYADESSYQGQWKHDLMEGNGIFADAKGVAFEGKMLKGERHGKGTLTNPDGTVFAVVYRNGTIHEKTPLVKA